MADLLSGGVMRGLVGASSAMKFASTSMSVYAQAKARKDEATMQRALGYATDSMSDAADATEESKAALAENVRTAREQEQAEQVARLEKSQQESANRKAEIQVRADDPNDKITNPIDTVELSSEAVAVLQREQSVIVDAPSEDISDFE